MARLTCEEDYLICKPARYLLRFDDFCPTMDRRRWERFVPLVEEFGVRPILAVVPENLDAELARGPADDGFWDQMRRLEMAGAAIGLHGLHHRCASRGRSLVPLHERSEFAGVESDVQRAWIREGLAILRGHGLNPAIWVAPRHGFDRNTLWALRQEGIRTLSDGLARTDCLRGGVRWIPQQLWGPETKSSGLWTICLHANTAQDIEVDKLREFLEQHAAQFTSIREVLAEGEPGKLGVGERLYERTMTLRASAKRVFANIR
jgi:predicted deacetylase